MPGFDFFIMDEKISALRGGRKVDFTMEGGLHKYLKTEIMAEARDVW